MNAKEIAEKYVYGKHDALTDAQEVVDMTADIEKFADQFKPKWYPVKQGDQVEEGKYWIWFEHPTRGGYMDHHFLIDDMPYKYGKFISKVITPSPPLQ